VLWGTKCPRARPARLVECIVILYRASQIESPLPSVLARRPTSQSGILSSSSAVRSVMRHKVSRDTEIPEST
jgi:hypothetical protein